MVIFHSADKSQGFHIYQTGCLQECTQPGTVPVVMVLRSMSINKTAFSSVQRDHTLCKYIIITYIERRESCCFDSEVNEYSSILERDNAVEWHWMETARPSDKSVNYAPTYKPSHPKDLKPCGANICSKSRQLSWSWNSLPVATSEISLTRWHTEYLRNLLPTVTIHVHAARNFTDKSTTDQLVKKFTVIRGFSKTIAPTTTHDRSPS
jgi:hypothetical protein